MMLEAKAICAEGCEHYKRAEAFRECIEIVKQMRNTEGVRLKGLSEDCESCRI